MAKSDRSTDSIEKLLEERSQYQQWLARLEGSAAPDTVKTRVRADYEARLDKVLGQLRSHESTIVEALAQHETELGTLESREASILETLAEAEVRHAVGEYEDKQWSEISSGQKKSLHEVRAGLERLRSEVGRLTEVQRLIRATPAQPETPVPVLAEPAAFAPPVAPEPQ
ncbi:MAG TPA: hypothetical protein VFU00_01705, partial [Gemmatimonadales bacterium]|nr:hypothetical protein [Gemmatimonadales bacterium]